MRKTFILLFLCSGFSGLSQEIEPFNYYCSVEIYNDKKIESNNLIVPYGGGRPEVTFKKFKQIVAVQVETRWAAMLILRNDDAEKFYLRAEFNFENPETPPEEWLLSLDHIEEGLSFSCICNREGFPDY